MHDDGLLSNKCGIVRNEGLRKVMKMSGREDTRRAEVLQNSEAEDVGDTSPCVTK